MRNSVRAGIVGAAAAMAVALGGVASAEPLPAPVTPAVPAPDSTEPGAVAPETSTPTPGAPAPNATTPETAAPTLDGIPGDAELAELLRALRSSGGTEQAIAALTSILGSQGQLDPQTILATLGLNADALNSILGPSAPAPGATAPTPPAAPDSAPANPLIPNQVDAPVTPVAGDVFGTLQKLTGTQTLTPALAPFCAAPTDDNPLGLVTAPAIAVPGPWPTGEGSVINGLLKGTGADSLLKLIDPKAGEVFTEIKDGQIAYALVPPTKPDSDSLNVAWFNTSTMQGGLEPLKPLKDDAAAGPLLKALAATEGFHGVRLARATTGNGTVLSAVFGTTTTSGRTCYFLPALGAVRN